MSFTKSYEPGEFEPDIYALWEKTGAFQPKAPVYEGKESDTENCYSLVMPPPNANGNLHIGHGLTIALEDSLARYYRLRGKSTWYIPGADHAGFETWVVYERALEAQGHSRFEYSRDELYARVWDFVEEQRGNMELQVRALGASCAWPDLTFTLDENVVDRVYKTFKKMWDDGMVYRGEKLVNFCPKHQTAFADIEVDHEDEKGHLWDIAYEVVSTPDKIADNGQISDVKEKATENGQIANGDSLNGQTDASSDVAEKAFDEEQKADLTEIIVSTTRPETLFGDVAVAVNPEDKRYKGLIGGLVKLPLTDRLIPIIADEHADPEYGTGAVKITPAHDFDDFEVGQRHDLERIQVIGEDGKMLEMAGKPYAGMTTAECREQVLHDLEEQGLLRGEKEIVHSVAHCYKCGAVIEPMLKAQWFIDVKRLAQEAIKHLEAGEITFTPANKKKVLINYLQNLKDWNISRQIPWGIPIPAYHQEVTDQAPEWIFDTRTNLRQIEVGGITYTRDEDTFDTWFSSSHWPLVCTDWTEGVDVSSQATSSLSSPVRGHRTSSTAPLRASNSPRISSEITTSKEVDVSSSAISLSNPVAAPSQDVKSSSVRCSGSSRTSSTITTSENATEAVSDEVTKGRENPYYPLNVMETGADILFAWVARMIMMGVYVSNEVPFREVYLHGLVLDEHGKKMSKSKGNVINPLDLVTKYGSDAFRLGILRGRSAGMNQAFSENSVIAGRNLCNKLWNLARFIQSLVDESQSGSPVAMEMAMAEMDAEIVNEGAVIAGAELPYSTDNVGEDWICRELTSCKEEVEDDFAAYRFAEAVETLTTTIWDKYADWFIESQKIYKNVPLLKVTLEMILKMLHPFAPFVTEAIWQSLSWTSGLLITQKWPTRLKFDPISAANFDSLRDVVVEARRLLTALSEPLKGKKVTLLYDNDAIVDDNQLLVAKLAGVSSVISCEGQPRGLRLALPNHEVYLDVSAEIVKAYRDKLEERILAVGKELDALNARMMNPSYVDKAPAHLVKQTRDGIAEKTALIERLKHELEVI